MDHIIGFPYPFSNSALKNCLPIIIGCCLRKSQRYAGWRIICQGGVSQGFPPTSKEVEEEEEKEEEEKENQQGGEAWVGDDREIGVAPGLQALGADLKKVNEKEDKKKIEYLQNESGVAGHRDQGCWNRN